MKELRAIMRYDPFIYQIAEKWSVWPDDVAEQPYSRISDIGYYCEWEVEDTKLKQKFEGKRGDAKARLQEKMNKGR